MDNKQELTSHHSSGDRGIIFMGTPEFAVASLAAIIDAGFSVLAVITAPDKPAGRGMSMQESAVKKYAIGHGIPVLQPEKLKDPVFLETLRSLGADLQIVVAFRMLPEVVWSMPPMGTVNLHASLLPQYRGAAPINWAVINGEKETGLTTFKLQQEIDTGNILLQERLTIGPNETAGELHDRMKDTGATLLVKTIRGLFDASLNETPQDVLIANNADSPSADSLKHAPKIFSETCRINWNLPTSKVHDLIRGLSPFPGAFTTLRDKTLKIFLSEKENIPPAIPPGQWESDKKTFFKFACSDGYVHIKELQVEGKKRMGVMEFLRGFRE